jgi:hypothetical protein
MRGRIAVDQPGQVRCFLGVVRAAHRHEDRRDLVGFDAFAQQPIVLAALANLLPRERWAVRPPDRASSVSGTPPIRYWHVDTAVVTVPCC